MQDRPLYYVLENTTIVPVEDVLAWALWFETMPRRVAHTALPHAIEVSTVFLGLDHQFCAAGPPLLFETMVFQGDYANGRCSIDRFTARWSTYHQAEQGHEAICAQVCAWLHEEIPDALPR